MNRYIAFDIEAGGTEEAASLLETYFEILNENFEAVDSLYLKVRPDDGLYVVSARGLKINGINLIEHDETAIGYSAAYDRLREFLSTHSERGKVKLIPFGHGIAGDINAVVRSLFKGNYSKWTQYASFRMVDTAIIAQHYKLKGVIPEEVSGSLDSLASFYGVSVDEPLHTAKGDTLRTILVYKAMLLTP